MATNEKIVRIRFDGSAGGLVTAVAEAKAAIKDVDKAGKDSKGLDDLGKKLGSIASGFGNAAKSVGMFTAKVAAVSSGVNIVTALGSALVTAAGALPLAVAGVMALGGALIATKLGADGVKAAFTQLNPELTALKAHVSASFEQSLLPAVNNLKGILPQVTSGFQQVATAMGGTLTSITQWLQTPAAIGQVNTILSGTAQVVRNVGAGFAPILAAFTTIGAVAMPILVQLTAGFGGAAQSFSDWAQRMADNGSIAQWIHNALDLFKSLWYVIKDVGSIVGGVFKALQDSGVGFSGIIGPVIGQIKDFVQSAQGHDTIVALAQGIQQVGQAVGQVLGAALLAIGPALPALAQAFGAIALQVAAFLVPAIQMLAPILLGLATFIQQNITWLGPLILLIAGMVPVIQAVIAVVSAWKAITEAFQIAQMILNAIMMANPIGLIILAIIALIAIIVLIISNLDFFKGIWDSVWRFCSDVITAVWNWIKDNWPLLLEIIAGPIGWAVALITRNWGAIQDGAGAVIGWLRGAWDSVGGFIMGVFSSIGSFASGIWSGIVGAARSAINGVIGVVNGAINGVNSVTGAVGIPGIPHIPMLARGGTARSGQSYLVGENGPELFTPGRTGRVTNAGTTAEAMGGGGGTGAQTINLTLDLGAGIQQVVQIQIEANNSATARAIGMGIGGSR